jgi:hypothetical protein
MVRACVREIWCLNRIESRFAIQYLNGLDPFKSRYGQRLALRPRYKEICIRAVRRDARRRHADQDDEPQLPPLAKRPWSPEGARRTRPIPSLTLAEGTWCGALKFGQFFPPCPGSMTIATCTMKSQRSMKNRRRNSGAFLYLGPQDLRLWQKTPADIALDDDYMRELDRRAAMQ